MESIPPPREVEPPSEFFLDRSLGKRVVATMLRRQGHIVHLMADLYPDGGDQLVGDDEWIQDVSPRGWIALTKDSNIARYHRDALSRSTLRVFSLDSAQLTGAAMEERYRHHLDGILRRSAAPGPYVYVLHTRDIELRWSTERKPD